MEFPGLTALMEIVNSETRMDHGEHSGQDDESEDGPRAYLKDTAASGMVFPRGKWIDGNGMAAAKTLAEGLWPQVLRTRLSSIFSARNMPILR